MRRMVLTLALAAMIPLTACDRSPSGPAAEVSGTYALETVNGDELPFTLAADGDGSVEVMEGSIRFMTDGTFEDRLVVRFTEGETHEDEEETLTGTYVVNGRIVTMSYASGGSSQVLVEGDRLTQTVNTFTLVYRR
ncbi:MAG TPA: hypothetical protein VK929_09365 [Longimicrobiales bacterium]|nr:hypothetical protein [Longimicrobiales bacterium]